MDGDGVKLTAFKKITEDGSTHQTLDASDLKANNAKLDAIFNELTTITSSLKDIIDLQKELLEVLKKIPQR